MLMNSARNYILPLDYSFTISYHGLLLAVVRHKLFISLLQTWIESLRKKTYVSITSQSEHSCHRVSKSSGDLSVDELLGNSHLRKRLLFHIDQ